MFLSNDMINAENAVTKVSPNPMISVLRKIFVTANVEHIPKICTVTGLFFKRSSLMISIAFFVILFVFGEASQSIRIIYK